MMNRFIFFGFLIFFSHAGFGQIQKVQLSTYSFYVNKKFVIDDLTKAGTGIKVIVFGENKSEPAGLPIYISAQIQCGREKLKDMRLERFFKSRFNGKFKKFLSSDKSRNPLGQLHVCSLESVNFDHEKIFISILDSGESGCRQDETIDLIIPIKEFCI